MAGFALAGLGRLRAIDRWGLAAALGTFAVFAAPTVLSGHATWAGYIKLDDTATWLAMTDRVMDHGRDLSGLAPSTYEVTLHSYLAASYPVGSFLPLGIGHVLLGQDSAWLFQPVLGFYAAMLALGLYALAAPLIASPRLRAAVAFGASQPALLFGYSLWGGIKELAAAWILVAVAATTVLLLRERPSVRSLIPAAVACAATLSILSLGGAVWLAPPLLMALAILLRSAGPARALTQAALFTCLLAVLAIPSLTTASPFLSAGRTVLTSNTELGNLVEPLNGLQVLGIWPAGDFRFDPSDMAATYALLVVLGAAGLGALALALRRRTWGPLLYFVSAGIGCLVVTRFGSPWVDGKALTTASPAFTFVGLLGGAAILQSGRRIEGAMIVLALAGGIFWSNFLAYRDVNLAPRERMAELEKIGHQIAGEGPTLMTDYEPFGARHFLRAGDPEGASEFRRRLIPLRDGNVLQKLEVADIDRFQLQAVLVYRTLVLRRSPVASRPPSVYQLVWRGTYYEVWQRPETAVTPIQEHLSLGAPLDPVAIPRCGQMLRLARLAGSSGQLAAVERPSPSLLRLGSLALPHTWRANDPSTVTPSGAGSVESILTVPRAGRYGLWIGGAFRRDVKISIDGSVVADARNRLSHAGEYVPMGTLDLSAGAHSIVLRYGGADLHPGSDGEAFPIGPLVLSLTTADSPVIYVSPGRARSLCGKRLDWIEALHP